MADNNDVSLSESQINNNLSETESRIMAGVTSQSTPTSVKKENNSDMMSIMLSQFEKINSNFENFETKFNEMNNSFNVKFDIQNRK